MDNGLDEHGQPLNTGFNIANNRRKAMLGLFRLCDGLIADNELTPTEVTFLDVWLKENSILRNDPDYQDLVEAVSDVLEDGLVTAEELDDLTELLKDIVQYRGGELYSPEEELEYLLGYLRGLVADQVLTEFEIMALRAWVHRSNLPHNKWPTSELLHRIECVVDDGIITAEEAKDLHETVSGLLGGPELIGMADGTSATLPLDVVECVEFEGRTFCVTGKLVHGTRRKAEMEIESRGGIPVKTVTGKLDYLVVGALASRDWAHSSFGRKIEAALEQKGKGREIMILSEEVLVSYFR